MNLVIKNFLKNIKYEVKNIKIKQFSITYRTVSKH